MNKHRFLSYIKTLKYKEPKNINININTIKNIPEIKKNTDINDINFSKNFWKNINKYKSIFK